MNLLDLNISPLLHFQRLFTEAEKAQVPEVNAMALATVNSEGRPSNRVVLYKGMVREMFSFFTNYESPKSQHLLQNPYASAVFFWPSLNQQIRIEGQVQKLSRQESEAYFASRPRLSQLGAWASEQSQPIPDYDYFKNKFERINERFAQQEVVPCPPYWGGFGLTPTRFEFWFGVQGRLHERYNFILKENLWSAVMLSP